MKLISYGTPHMRMVVKRSPGYVVMIKSRAKEATEIIRRESTRAL